MPISVIITTSPGREENLDHCLWQLHNQSFQDFEVIIVDDGSEQGQHIARKHVPKLDINYLGRPNDMNVCRSRNLGVEQAHYQQLVFLDSDILLNPPALESYATHFEAEPETVWGGYFGYVRDFVSPSAFVPGRQINYLDRRFLIYAYQMIQPSTSILTEPGRMFWSGNIGLKRELYEEIKGFDEQFVGWGGAKIRTLRFVFCAQANISTLA